MGERRRHVLILNHFAAPRAHAGGTRHVELFGRLEEWTYLILAADKNYLTGDQVASEPGFLAVPVSSYTSNGWRRVLNWVTFAWNAFFIGLRQRKPEVVYASSPHLLAALAGWLIASARRVPFVLEIRDLWPQVLVDMGQLSPTSRIYRLLSRLETFLYARAAAVVVMAEGSRAELEKRGVPSDSIVYIPNGADPEDFVSSASRDDLRKHYGFSRFTAVYAGAHGPANGLDFLLDAAEELRHEDLEIILVGGGVSKDALLADANQRGLSNVRFLEPVPKSEIPDLLAAADLGLHVLADVELFRTAVSPNKVFDYMAAGLPVLTNSPGLVSDLVTEAHCGLAVAPERLAGGLREMLTADLEKMSRNGVSWISEHQSRRAMALKVSDVLTAVTRPGLTSGNAAGG